MINWIEKGRGLLEVIRSDGHWVESNDGVWSSSDDTAVQLIIDSYDPLPHSKDKAIERIEREATKRASLIYAFIGSAVSNAISQYNMASDLYLSTITESRNPLTGRLLAFKGVHDAAMAAISDINAMTDWQLINAYDAVNTPAWT